MRVWYMGCAPAFQAVESSSNLDTRSITKGNALSNMDLITLFIKTPIVFMHFCLAAYAIVSIISLDLKIFFNYTKPLTESLLNQIKKAEFVLSYVLLLLYASGIFFLIHGAYTDPKYFVNEKLLFKLALVGALTINGGFVAWISNTLKVGDVFSKFRLPKKLALILVGGFSSTAWTWACFIGVARLWNFKLSFLTLGAGFLMNYAIVIVFLTIALAIQEHIAEKKQAKIFIPVRR